ncbi:MAG: class I SAM-dependent methyltransferase [Rubrivivax sp.]|jgi:SAM-dependent methyltransferase|nr:class I SAM-dependent methyltransferase [Rubrivivax sp.]
MNDEPRAVAERYARRGNGGLYSPLEPDVWQTLHERQRVLLGFLSAAGHHDLSMLTVTEVGCGSGGNLLELLRLGFAPAHLTGLELLPQRCAQARAVLPAATRLWQGDATQAPLAPASQDLVFAYTVFSSLLDDAFQQRLADAMWGWLKPGGAVVWYDFTVDNPRNPDVRGMPARRVAQLFARGTMRARRVTLAPPIGRRVVRLTPAAWRLFNAVPLLRTHLLAWIEKPA